MQVLSYNEAAAKAGIVRRTLERLISLGEGPAVIEISPRRRGVMESDLEQWLNARRRVPPGFKESQSADPRTPPNLQPRKLTLPKSVKPADADTSNRLLKHATTAKRRSALATVSRHHNQAPTQLAFVSLCGSLDDVRRAFAAWGIETREAK